jgi:peptidoglycan/LPS O-acetylase OafA/YrhL
VPYLAVILAAVLIKKLSYSGENPALSAVFNSGWQIPEDARGNFMAHLLMVGRFDYKVYNGSVWTLVHEMRISLVFPFFFNLFKNAGRGVTAAAGLLLSALAKVLIGCGFFPADILMSVHYLGLFFLGMALAKASKEPSKGTVPLLFEQAQEPSLCLVSPRFEMKMAVLLLIAVLIFTAPALGFTLLPEIVSDWIAAAGAALFILLLLTWDRAARFLQKPVFLSLGKISYSLYLWHMVILNALLHLFFDRLTTASIFLMSFLLTLAISGLSHTFLEIPAINWGKTLTVTKSK